MKNGFSDDELDCEELEDAATQPWTREIMFAQQRQKARKEQYAQVKWKREFSKKCQLRKVLQELGENIQAEKRKAKKGGKA